MFIEIPGTNITKACVTTLYDGYSVGDSITSSAGWYYIYKVKKCEYGIRYLIAEYLIEEELEIAIDHYKFLKKHNLV